MDLGYNILLSHLHNFSTTVPLPTIQGVLAHHLATISPVPTPLAATAISSPLFLAQPFTHLKLQIFLTTFRHATHLRYRAIIDATKTRSKVRTMLGRSRESVLAQWVTDVLKGVQGGHPILRLAACGGLLLGVEDVKIGEKPEKGEGIVVGNARSAVEDEIVVSLAEVMDKYSPTPTASNESSANSVEEWEKEFQPAGQGIISIAMILASQSLPLVAQHRLEALPLPAFAALLMSTISLTFNQGTFLSSVSASVTLSPIHISPSSPLAQTLHSMTSSPLTSTIAPISRLTAKILSTMLDSQRAASRTDNLYTVSDLLELVREMAKTIERDWISCPLASSVTEQDIAPSSTEMSKKIWTTLKTFLFTTITLYEAVLISVIYMRPQPSCDITPATLALQTLHTLSHLSFVIFQFGGVTTMTQGFEHLKTTFYLALDILAKSESGSKAEAYVQQSCLLVNSMRTESVPTVLCQAKQAFVLAGVGQLVPVLSNKCIRDWVWGVCYPHLYDSTHQQTYEFAHSLILAIFASHAQRQQQQLLAGDHSVGLPQPSSTKVSLSDKAKKYLSDDHHHLTRAASGILKPEQNGNGAHEGTIISQELNYEDESITSAKFMQRLVPFYAKCLIENSGEGKLNTSQLRLAFAALVRSASLTNVSKMEESYNLAWYCTQLLLDTIHELSPDSDGKGKAEEASELLHRLQLALISTVPSLPQPLMLRCLDHIRNLISVYPKKPDGGGGVDANDDEAAARWRRKTELVEALFHEILEKISDQDKGFAMSWWYKNLPTLIPEQTTVGKLVWSDGLKEETGRAIELKEKESLTEAVNESLSSSVPQSRL